MGTIRFMYPIELGSTHCCWACWWGCWWGWADDDSPLAIVRTVALTSAAVGRLWTPGDEDRRANGDGRLISKYNSR